MITYALKYESIKKKNRSGYLLYYILMPSAYYNLNIYTKLNHSKKYKIKICIYIIKYKNKIFISCMSVVLLLLNNIGINIFNYKENYFYYIVEKIILYLLIL